MDSSVAAGLTGAVMGLLFGVIGTWVSFNDSKTPAERRFIVRACVWGNVGIALFLAILFLLPAEWRWAAWIPYVIALPFAANYVNRRQSALRGPDGNPDRLLGATGSKS